MTVSGVSFDRDSAGRVRDDVWHVLDAHPNTLIMLAHDGRIAVRESGEVFHDRQTAPSGERVYLGVLRSAGQDRPVELRLIDQSDVSDVRWWGIRDAMGHSDPVEIELSTTAIALAHWREAQRYCPSCGQLLTAASAGWVLECGCGSQVWPRLSPAVITLIEDGEGRVLLGSNAMWEHNRYSLLAGFVEPGETLESAVIREVAEESGVEVVDPRYVASQAWPAPASLMLGFRARAVSTELQPDGEEILDLRWFDRESIVSSDIRLPRRGALARTLLEEWFGGVIPERHD